MSLPSRSANWQNVRDLEDTMATLADARTTCQICLTHARQLGHRQLLAELYRLRRDLWQLTTRLSAEWYNRGELTHDIL